MLEIVIITNAVFSFINFCVIAVAVYFGRHKERVTVDEVLSDEARLDAFANGSIVELREISRKSAGKIHIHDVEVILNKRHNTLRKCQA